MTAATVAPSVPTPVTGAGRVTFPRVVRSEWTKFRSLRSTWWSLGTAVVLIVGLGALVASQGGIDVAHPTNIARTTLIGVVFGQLVTAVLAVLLVSGEYGTGMIRASMTAVPKRLPVLWAKAAVYTAVVLPLTLVTALVTFLLGQAIRSGRGLPTASLGDPGVLRIVVGSSLYVTVAGLLALGIATVIRSTAAGVAAVVGLYFVVPIVANLLPASINGFAPYLPSNAGGAVWDMSMTDGSMAPWTGFALLAGYAAVALAAGVYRLLRTDV